MHKHFEVLISYNGICPETGKEKKFKELYLFEAVSFTDCEAQAIEFAEKSLSQEFFIENINPVKYDEIHLNGGDYFYKCKIMSLIEDDSGKTKKSYSNHLLQADKFDQIDEILEIFMQGVIIPWVNKSVIESKIVDVCIDY